MRKWIWSGTALLVFSCAAMYLAAQHAAEHPDSVAAGFFRGASTVGMRCNPLLAIMPATLPEPPCTVDKPCKPLCVLPDPAVMAQEHPLVPLPAIGEAPEAPEVSEPIVVESEPPPPPGAEEPLLEELVTEQAVVGEPEYPEPGYGVYPLPGASEQPTAPVASGDDEEILPQPANEPYGYENSDEQGPSMPYVSDDADEFEDTCTDNDACEGVCGACRDCPKCESCPGPKMGCCSSCGMLRIIKVMCCGEGCPECAKCAKTLGDVVAEYLSQLAGQEEAVNAPSTGVLPPLGNPLPPTGGILPPLGVDQPASDTPEDAPASDNVETPPDAGDVPPSDETPMNPDETQDSGVNPDHHPAREHPHYHHEYPSCPYTGRCPYPYHYNIPRVDPVVPRSNETPPTQPTQPADTHADEQQQSSVEPMPPVKPSKVKKKKFFFLYFGEEASECQQPGVDTMECRPSDLHGKVRSPF